MIKLITCLIGFLFASWFLADYNLMVQCVIFGLYLLFVLFLFQKNGILHPVSWMSTFLFLYTIAYPLFRWEMGVPDEISSQVVKAGVFASISFVVGSMLTSPARFQVPEIKYNQRVLVNLFYIVLASCSLLISYALLSGATTKREFLNFLAQSNFAVFFNLFSFLSALVALLLLKVLNRNPKWGVLQAISSKHLTLAIIVLFIAFGVTGERDFLFRVLLVTILIFYSVRRGYNCFVFPVVGAIAFILMPWFQNMKGFLLSSDRAVSQNTSIFWSEFASSGRNLHYVIDRKITSLNGETYINDLKRNLEFLYPDAQSTTAWFNNVVRTHYGDGGTSGWGFSLIGEGYINFGMPGVVYLFFIIGLLMGAMFRMARVNQYFFILYILSIPTTIYILRADVGNFISQNFKVNLSFVMLLWLCSQLSSKYSRENL